ncbi:hypothetical protein [Legionella maioricensis]|uniref:Ku protein n=1 Tax=Legionella maioricensis TaxID=2896528 RepID=A0A9X2D3K0_9GAMM|nr:hypothetical protein [Legionella maioricensis]MCL9688988.1 hypothetical protein [Legionella maioricensis]
MPVEPVKNYKVTDKKLKMATDLIKDMSAEWKPEKYHNEYRESLQKWLNQQTEKLLKEGKKVRTAPKSNEAVVDFITLLKKSMGKKVKPSSKKKTS